MLELIANPKVLELLGITTGLGGLIGFLIRGLFGGGRAVIDERLRIALERYQAALKTADKDDDKRALADVELLRSVRAFVGGIDPTAKK